MAEHSSIEWCDATFNPWIGCTKVSPACDHCYAERDFDHRRHVVQWGAGQARKRTGADNWEKPLKWNKRAFYECDICGWRGDAPEMGFPGSILEKLASCPSCDAIHLRDARRRVFCASLADVFDNEVPVEWLVDLLDLIRSTPNLDWLLLTKRIGNWQQRIEAVIREIDGDDPCELRAWLWSWINDSPPRNVWLGATICNQDEADRDIPKLLATPARVRFLSIEPMLGPINLTLIPHSQGYGSSPCDGCGTSVARDALDGSTHCESGCDGPILTWLDWVICGGESGPKARPMHPDWARSLRDQCAVAGVAFLFKQWGEFAPEGHPEQDRPHLVDEYGARPVGLKTWVAPMLDRNRQWLAYRVGKKAAGRLLDGVEHNGFPRSAA